VQFLHYCPQHNSTTNDPKAFKLGLYREWPRDILRVVWFWGLKGQRSRLGLRANGVGSNSMSAFCFNPCTERSCRICITLVHLHILEMILLMNLRTFKTNSTLPRLTNCWLTTTRTTKMMTMPATDVTYEAFPRWRAFLVACGLPFDSSRRANTTVQSHQQY